MYNQPGAGRFEIALTMGNSPRRVLDVVDDQHTAEVRARELGTSARAVNLADGTVYVPSLRRWVEPDTNAVAEAKAHMTSPRARDAFAAMLFDLGADMMRLQAEGLR